MTSITQDPHRRRVVVGVDTHKHIHVAVGLDAIGGVIGSRSFAADSGGYAELIAWAIALGGSTLTFAIEGTGSYGAGLTSAVRSSGLGAVEVMRTDRRDRRLRGKSDTLDAENAARTVLSGNATAVPKTNDGTVEMIRQIKVAKDVAVKGRSAAIISLKTVIVNAEPALREQLQPLPRMALIERCAGLRPGQVTTVAAATKHTLRAIARRWQQLNTEVIEHEKILTRLTRQLTPDLVAAHGIGCDTAAEMLIVAGDNAHRVRTRLGQTPRGRPRPCLVRHDQPTPTEPRRPPPRQHGPLPRRDRPHAIPRTHQGLRRPQNRRGQDQTRDHPLPETTSRPRDLGTHAPLPRSLNHGHSRRLTPIGASRGLSISFTSHNAHPETGTTRGLLPRSP